jgi:trimethylamine--corrinoid protein Co-methyltransferase
MIRHAFGALGNLQYFSLQKFNEDCSIEKNTRKQLKRNVIGEMNVLPLYLPEDGRAMEAVRELAIKGNPRVTDHTLQHIDSFRRWENRVAAEEAKGSPDGAEAAERAAA